MTTTINTTTINTTTTKLSVLAQTTIEAKRKVIRLYEKIGNQIMVDILNLEIQQITNIYKEG